jgi:hypothetical protein
VRIRAQACDPAPCAELEPQEVVAITATDVWLTASRGGSRSELELLHTQPATGPAGVYVLDDELLEREAWSEVPPAAYYPTCQSVLLVLGPTHALEEARVLEVSRKLGDFPSDKAVRGRLGGEQVWALESLYLEDSKYKTVTGALAAWKKQIPSAKLVCARVLVDRTITLK